MRRRAFLGTAAALAAGAAAGAVASLVREPRAKAFGEPPAGTEQLLLPENLRAQSVLEIFLFGGVSQYESFYTVPDYGAQDSTQWYLHLNSGELDATLTSCNYSGDLLLEFGADANAKKVYLGPFTKPLRDRGDILDRMRICIASHQAQPHEVAIPLGLSGRPLGHPTLAGLGAHIQRFYIDAAPDLIRPPYSFVLRTSQPLMQDLTRAALATGTHPANTRPLGINIDAAAELVQLLKRSAVGSARGPHDALVAANIERFRSRLRWDPSGDPLRAPRFGDLAEAAKEVANSDVIDSVLNPRYFTPVAGTSCGLTQPTDATRMNLRLAAYLLNHPQSPARYVCVVDGGLMPSQNAGGYDSHTLDCTSQATNLLHSMESLAEIIRAPGETSPLKIDLDKTLVILNTDFGRTPNAEGALMNGRGHWPFGFPVVFIGGPVRSANRGVYGACGADAKATDSLQPQEHRIAALLALGIWPFEPESYNVSDVRGASQTAQAVGTVHKKVFGIG